MKKLFIYPAHATENHYITIQEQAIRNAGVDVTYSLKNFLSTDYFLLNWFETLGGNKVLDFSKKVIKLILLKMFRKKILWVVHNKKPHSKYRNDSSCKLSVLLMTFLLNGATKIIILCDETRNILAGLSPRSSKYLSKIYKIPHPNYIGSYPLLVKNKPVVTNQNLKLLYIGQINQYKNIELLIDVINQMESFPITLLIAGNCKDSNYKDKLISSITNKKIMYDFRFIPDENLVSLLAVSDIVVLPYSMESSLNSGTVFLAFSNKKTIISPLIGTLKEYITQDFFYTYEYTSVKEHKLELIKSIMKALDDYKTNPEIMKIKGKKAFSIVKENNSLEKISSLYNDLFLHI